MLGLPSRDKILRYDFRRLNYIYFTVSAALESNLTKINFF